MEYLRVPVNTKEYQLFFGDNSKRITDSHSAFGNITVPINSEMKKYMSSNKSRSLKFVEKDGKITEKLNLPRKSSWYETQKLLETTDGVIDQELEDELNDDDYVFHDDNSFLDDEYKTHDELENELDEQLGNQLMITFKYPEKTKSVKIEIVDDDLILKDHFSYHENDHTYDSFVVDDFRLGLNYRKLWIKAKSVHIGECTHFFSMLTWFDTSFIEELVIHKTARQNSVDESFIREYPASFDNLKRLKLVDCASVFIGTYQVSNLDILDVKNLEDYEEADGTLVEPAIYVLGMTGPEIVTKMLKIRGKFPEYTPPKIKRERIQKIVVYYGSDVTFPDLGMITDNLYIMGSMYGLDSAPSFTGKVPKNITFFYDGADVDTDEVWNVV